VGTLHKNGYEAKEFEEASSRTLIPTHKGQPFTISIGNGKQLIGLSAT